MSQSQSKLADLKSKLSDILTIPSPGAKLHISVSILVLGMYILVLCRIRLCYSLLYLNPLDIVVPIFVPGCLTVQIFAPSIVGSKELDLCYNSHFHIQGLQNQKSGCLICVYVYLWHSQVFEVPPTALCPRLRHFQAESAGRAWFVRKSSMSATTFIFIDFRFWRPDDPEIRHPGTPHR